MAGRKTCGSGAVPEGFRAPPPVRGRGTGSNPQGRFERLQRDAEDDGWTGADAAVPAPGTTVTGERAQKVLFSEPYYTGGIAALVREPEQR